MSNINVQPTAEVIETMAKTLRDAAAQLDAIAARTRQKENFEVVGEAASCVANLMPNLRLDLLVIRPLREFGAG